MQDQTFSSLLTPKRIRYALFLILGVVGISIVVNFLLQSDEFQVTSIGIPSSNESVGVVGDNIYSFNGAVFYKQSLTKNSPLTVLSGGIKLPTITKALWVGDKGVILNFDQSLSRTLVEEEAREIGLGFSEKRNSTWYYNFSSNTIHHIGSFLLDTDSSYFDGSDTIYYLQTSGHSSDLHMFNVNTKKDTATSLSLGFYDVRLIDKCQSSENICITGTPTSESDDNGIYEILKKGVVKKVFTIDGEVYPLKGSPWVLTLSNSDDLSDNEDGNIPQFSKAKLINVATSESRDINHGFSAGNFLYSMYENDRFVSLIDGGDSYLTSGTRAGISRLTKNKTHRLSGQFYTGGYITASSNSRNIVLLSSINEGYATFARSNYIKGDFSVIEEFDAQEIVKKCSNDATSSISEDNTFTIYLIDNASFDKNIKIISDCLTSNNLVRGYSFTFTSIDPNNNRPTSY